MKVEDCFRIGSILKTKGLKGEMQLYVDIDGLNAIKFKAVFVDMAGKLVPYFVKSVKYPMPGTVYLNLEDVDTIEKASLLVKKNIYLPNKIKPKKKEEDFTLMDLKGFTAVDIYEGELGVITDIHEYPQQLIATVTYKNCEVLFPLNEEIIKGIDIVQSIVTVDLPEGLLDIYLD
ncbi:MAG: ribosome maturation factor RimM [Mucilaginibacter sp.]